jgi:glutamyl-tRNA reductase
MGMNHKTAPVEVREHFSITDELLGQKLTTLLSNPFIKEAAILATCNRVEYILSVDHIHRATRWAKKILAEDISIDPDTLERSLYIYFDKEAVRHLFRVSSSLDSMIIGEPQILGQVKDAYRKSSQYKACGNILNKLFHQAFRVAKKVRTDTEIAKNAVSVSYAAVELAKRIFDILEEKCLMLIGAGEMIELALRHFKQHGVRKIYITNRTYSRAIELSQMYNAQPIPFEKFQKMLLKSDIILSCTASQNYILEYDDIKNAMKLRKNKTMFLIDIAVPRDIDPKVNNIDNVYLYDIDDLQDVVDRNIEIRMSEMEKAEAIIEREVNQFFSWLNILNITPTIKALQQKAENIRMIELDKTLSKLKNINEKEKRSIDLMTKAIVKKLLHDPISELKRESSHEYTVNIHEATKKLFGLNKDDDSEVGRS